MFIDPTLKFINQLNLFLHYIFVLNYWSNVHIYFLMLKYYNLLNKNVNKIDYKTIFLVDCNLIQQSILLYQIYVC
jgi:hypothetical protein